MTQALYRKWRPQTFEEVVGQEHVVHTLRNGIASGRVHHAYLFAGPRGTGKTTTARLLAKAVNCLAEEPADRPCNECAVCRAVNEGRLMDLIEIDAASNTGVDDVRELRERVGYRPNEARYKVYVIDEVHMLSNAAFNALLKTLEEPPPHAIFVLATTEPQRIPATVISRCQRFDFHRIPLTDIISRLRHLTEQEGIAADDEALTLIARQATGSMRDAESLLDQLAAYNEGITGEVVRTALGTGTEESVTALTDALASGDVGKGLGVINAAMDRGTDPRQFARQVAEHLRWLMHMRLGSNVTLLIPEGWRDKFQAQASQIELRQLTRGVRLFSQAAAEARAAWQPQLPLELAFVEAALPAEERAAPGGDRPTPPPPPRRRQDNSSPVALQPTPAKAASPGQPAAGSGLGLEQVQDCWPELLRVIRQHNLSLEALLRSGEPIGVEENAVLIGFAHQFHKSKVEEDSCRRVIEEALERLLARPVQMRCVLTKPRQVRPPSPPEEDSLVQAAVERLGARVAHHPPSG